MWINGNQFCTEYANYGHVTQYCGVEVEFDQSNCVSHHDQNLIEGRLGYIRKIQEIMQVDISSFQCVIFCCKWWDKFDRRNVKEGRDSGLICINYKKIWVETKEPYVFPKIATNVFLPRCVGWVLVVHTET
jgi:hypothetical protein